MIDFAHAPLTRRVWKGRRVLILGLGQYPKGSGISAARLFAKLGANVTVTDQKTQKELSENVRALKKYPHVRFVLGQHRLADVRNAELIVPNPRVRRDSRELKLARKLGIPVKSEIALFLDHCPGRIIGVTGTRGKSTTTALIAHILGKRTWLGGNILVSPLTFLAKVKPKDTVVLELSSFQTETLGDVRPVDIAVITNIKRDHLNAYENMEEYAEAKARIFRNQTPRHTVILNADDAYGKRWISEAPSRVRTFRITDRLPVLRGDLPLLGEHNVLNALAAVQAAKVAGATAAQINHGLKTFRPLPNRLETIRVWRGVRFVNDTTATTPDGTIAAIKAMTPLHIKTWLILGGSDKGLEYSELARIVARHRRKLRILILPGSASGKIKALIDGHSVKTLTDAVNTASQKAQKGDCVLLSPGAASFGQFANEFERGKRFRELVKQFHA